MTLDEYCDTAKAINGMRFDAQLARELGITTAALAAWRMKKSWPADEKMIKLADLAGIDPIDALLDLNIWRSHGPAIALYTRIKKALAGTAAALLLALTVQAATPQDATASPAPLYSQASDQYILWKILCSRILNPLLKAATLFMRAISPCQKSRELSPC